MKLWEMIKELTENPEKEFVRKRDGLRIKAKENGELNWDSGHRFMKTNDEWEEVKKPVDFMTALRGLREGRKNIYCILDGEMTTYMERAKETRFFSEEQIAWGKWYIVG